MTNGKGWDGNSWANRIEKSSMKLIKFVFGNIVRSAQLTVYSAERKDVSGFETVNNS